MSILTSFTSLFKKQSKKTLLLPESLLLKKLYAVVQVIPHFHLFENIILYHHAKKIFLPLIILDEKRGIFLFEHKDWSYDDLKNSKIEKAKNVDSNNSNLAFDQAHHFIERKCNEIKHKSILPISNFLLMENINQDQYNHLETSIQALLPSKKIMFNDTDEQKILSKLENLSFSENKLPNINEILTTLFVQYAILDNKGTVHFASKEQRNFIDKALDDYTILESLPNTGKTSTILLKAIIENLKNPNYNIIIIKPTKYSCDILKKRLIDTIEYALIEIDISKINIITPRIFVKKYSKFEGLIICDDYLSYTEEFISQLEERREKNKIIIVKNSQNMQNNDLVKTYKSRSVLYEESNPHAKAIQIVSSLLKTVHVTDIAILAENPSKLKLKDDLEDFIGEDISFHDGEKCFIDQDINSLLLSSYKEMYALEKKYIILVDIDLVNVNELHYAYNLSQECVYVLYQNESDNLNLLRNNFESNKNKQRMARAT
ncbi:hypothetical protein JHD48_01340 [Sulfurimonas sp. SAG-AH-194-I05]|nr:hypothetical protein [Sulfurimonas sp. SAG-AH-194-I05]MDF1874373.1 hypothetical protein [Sulfurimonas sp. SAG-AH-194-I05]